jgi:hypothetical protein
MATRKSNRFSADRYHRVLERVHKILGDEGLGHLQVRSLNLVPTASIGDSQCPDGYVPKQVCEPTPEGGIRCYTKCVPAGEA